MPHQTIAKQRHYVLSYPIDLVSPDGAAAVIKEAWAFHKGLHIVTANAEMIIAAQKNEHLDKIIRQADLCIADGAGIVLALKLYGHNIQRLPGIELAQLALSQAAANNIPVSLIGGKSEILSALYLTLPQQYPGLKLVACQDGYFPPEEEQSVIKKIADSGAQLVLVAMGIPRQEYFIETARQSVAATFIGVGGSFDVWSGQKERAPAIFQDYHLEWLYRLIREPWRFQRMSSALPGFAGQVIAEFIKNKTA